MTLYSLMDGASGRPGVGSTGTQPPTSPVAFTGAFQAGTAFTCTASGLWLNGFRWWVPPGGDTGPQKFCLWTMTGNTAGTVVPGSTVTSGTLTAGAFNTITLASPVPLAIGGVYVASTAWVAVHGFPDTQNQFGGGNPYAAGITNGPLLAWADGSNGGSPGTPYNMPQGLFTTATSDPTTHFPAGGSNSSNFWVDVVVSDTAPATYSGTYRLWPNKGDAAPAAQNDAAVCYDVATEVRLSGPCTLNKIWYYSIAGASQLATAATVWTVPGGAQAAHTGSPSWSGAAGSGWISCSFTGVTLPAGTYRVGVFNGAAVPASWSTKLLNYWDTGLGSNGTGILSGPVYAPNLAHASTAFEYNGSNPGSTPPFTNGLTEPGQSVFSQNPNGGPDSYPQLYVDGLGQCYFIDIEVTPLAVTPSGLLMACIP